MKKYLTLFFLFFLSINVFSQITPNQIAGLKLWLRADSAVLLNGDSVYQWKDCSGIGNHANQVTPASQPLRMDNQLNGKPIIRFDGVDDYVRTGSFIYSQPLTIFLVYKVNSSAVQVIYQNTASNSLYLINYTNLIELFCGTQLNTPMVQPFSNFIIQSSIANGSNSSIYSNGIQLKNGDAGTGGLNSSFTIGYGASYNNYYFNGDIAEIILYNQPLTTTERQNVEEYLRQKYYPPVNLGPDIDTSDFCSITLDAGSQFTLYQWSTLETTQSIQVDTSGTYSVTVTDIFVYTSTDTIQVTYPKITLADTFFCSNSSVTLSTGLGSSYTYNWSNSATTETINVNTPGNYWVTVTDASFCSRISDTITVTEDDFPATASLGPDDSLCVGNSIGLVSPLPLPSGLTYQWSNLDTTPTISITTSGTYSVTVTDSNGCIATDAVYDTIMGNAPDVDFSFTAGCSGSPTLFYNESSPPCNTWLWDFGDGQTSSDEDAVYSYTNGDDYTVLFTVTDGICSSYLDSIIHIPQSPLAAFTVDSACINNPYSFFDQSISTEGNIISWDWDFGDATAHSSDTNPQHTYTLDSIFYVTLIITTDSVCSDTIIYPINVVSSAPSPVSFTLIYPSDSLSLSPGNINFQWNHSFGAISYLLEISTDVNFNNIVGSFPLSNNFYSDLLNISGNYYWRVTAYNICGNSITTGAYTISIFLPTDILGLNLWLKADEGVTGNPVTQWDDFSGLGNDATQSNLINEPTLYNSIPLLNFKPVIRFDGSNNFMDLPQSLYSQHAIFVLYKKRIYGGKYLSLSDRQVSSQCLLADWSDGNLWFQGKIGYKAFFGGNNTNYTFLTGSTDGTINGTNIYKNGNLVTSSGSGGTSFGDFHFDNIGYSLQYNTYTDGDIAEIIIYNQALTTTDRQTVENYLHYKYAPPVNLGPDIWSSDFCDTTIYASKRFISYLWNTGETTDSIIVNTGDTIWVDVVDVFDFPSWDTVIVHKPIVNVYGDTLCLGNDTTLHAGLGAPYSFIWEWNGDSIYTESYLIHAGDTVRLHVYDNTPANCSVNRLIIMYADSFPVLNLLGISPLSVCTGDNIYPLIDTSLIETYDWYDGASHSYNPYYTVTQTLGFTLTLTVTNARGCVNIDSVNVAIQGAQPNVGFTFTPVCYPGPVLTGFDDTSTPTAGSSFYWDFGDGQDTTLSSPNTWYHYYAAAGYYNVIHTVTTQQGCSKSITQQVPVYSVPVPAFQPHIGCSGVPLLIKDKSTSLVGNVSSWNWTITDPYSANNTSTYTNVWHTFDSTGWYHVKLVVTTQYGCTDSIIDSVQIRFGPKVGFTYTNVCDGNPVYFNDTTQTPDYAFIINWWWDFGNGQTSIYQNPVFTFDSPGTYPVILTVKSINGCEVSDTEDVVIHAIPVAEFFAEEICAESPYTFTENSSVLLPDSISSWTWDIGGLGTWYDKNPVITFHDTGTVPVTLTVASNAGCENTVSGNMKVNPVPAAAFTPDEYYGVAPFTVTFANNSQGAAGNYLWNFGDTIPCPECTQVNPTHQYTYEDSAGFTVTLIAYNDYGCTDTAYQVLYVTPTRADIAVANVKAVKQNNYVTLSADITNYGTYWPRKIDILAKAAGGATFKETWSNDTEPLKTGETMTYQFNAQYELSEDQATEYICVEAQIVNKNPDDNPANNEQCITLSNQFMVFEPYPTPTHDHVHIDFILPFSDNIEIELYGAKGDKVKTIFSGIAEKGLNRLTVDVSSLNLGVYYYRISFRDDKKILKFVKY